jgi:hypothetical protein
VMVISKGENGKQIMFAVDPTYRTETQKIQIDPLLDSYTDNLFFLDSKVFSVTKVGVQAFVFPIKRITLVEAIYQQVEQRNQPLENALQKEQITAKQLIAVLSNQLKPLELEQNLVKAVELLIRTPSSKDASKLQTLTFSFHFAHQFLVTELRSIQFNREQLAKLLLVLNAQLTTVQNDSTGIIFDWIGALFDAYFIAFNSLTNKTLLDLLKKTQSTLQEKIHLFQIQKQLEQSMRSSLETIPDDRGKIVIGLPDHKHLGYKLEEIYL